MKQVLIAALLLGGLILGLAGVGTPTQAAPAFGGSLLTLSDTDQSSVVEVKRKHKKKFCHWKRKCKWRVACWWHHGHKHCGIKRVCRRYCVPRFVFSIY